MSPAWRNVSIGIAIGLVALGAFATYQAFSHTCPCGFTFDPLTGGCTVILDSVPCGGDGGGDSSGGGKPPGGAPAKPPPDVTDVCSYRVVNCVLDPDWKGTSFDVSYSGGTISSGPGPKVEVRIGQRDKSGAGCVRISGTVDTPRQNFTHKIAFLANVIAGTFPDLKANLKDPCTPITTGMAIWPLIKPIGNQTPEGCGCRVTFQR